MSFEEILAIISIGAFIFQAWMAWKIYRDNRSRRGASPLSDIESSQAIAVIPWKGLIGIFLIQALAGWIYAIYPPLILLAGLLALTVIIFTIAAINDWVYTYIITTALIMPCFFILGLWTDRCLSLGRGISWQEFSTGAAALQASFSHFLPSKILDICSIFFVVYCAFFVLKIKKKNIVIGYEVLLKMSVFAWSGLAFGLVLRKIFN